MKHGFAGMNLVSLPLAAGPEAAQELKEMGKIAPK
jgi:hypothetical protein